MSNETKKLIFLNLASELDQRIIDFVESLDGVVVSQEVVDSAEEISFIFCDNELDAKEISKNYRADENSISLIATSTLKILKIFSSIKDALSLMRMRWKSIHLSLCLEDL
jgi:hypothetical protein